MSVAGANLWSDRSPSLYTLRTTVNCAATGAAVDTLDTVFGFRSMAWNADKGFILNGVPTKIKGLANHQVGASGRVSERVVLF